METVDTLVLGASAFGIGWVLAQIRKNILVADRGIVIADEFCAALRYTPVPTDRTWGNITASIIAECRQNNLLDADGHISVPAVMSVLSSRLYDTEVPVWLETSTADVCTTDDGSFLVTLFENRIGFTEVLCRSVLDTRPICPPFLKNPNLPEMHRYMRAVLCRVTPDVPLPEQWGEFAVEKGRFTDEYVISLPLVTTIPECNAIPATRAKFSSEWERLPHDGWKIAAIATEADTVYSSVPICRQGNYTWIPSCGWADIMTAVEEGSLWNTAV